MLVDNISVNGNLNVKLLDDSGSLKDERSIKNLVVNLGKEHIADRMIANTTVSMSHMAVGSSNTSPSVSNTGLGTELARVALDSATRSNATITYSATYAAGVGTGTIAEAGIFNDSSAGTMLCRTSFNEVNKASGDTLVITWNVTVS